MSPGMRFQEGRKGSATVPAGVQRLGAEGSARTRVAGSTALAARAAALRTAAPDSTAGAGGSSTAKVQHDSVSC